MTEEATFENVSCLSWIEGIIAEIGEDIKKDLYFGDETMKSIESRTKVNI